MSAKKKKIIPTKRPSTIAREADLLADYNRLLAVKEHGVQKYSHEYIVAQLNKKHHYSIKTIEKKLQQLS